MVSAILKIAIVAVYFVLNQVEGQTKPNIILIVADDLGWDDVSFHGSKQIYTPNIDALAFDGIILNNYYVEPLCTPSRAALMTGRLASHTGLQTFVIRAGASYGLPLNFTLMPQHMKNLGYSTHLVGKWHVGYHKWPYWPTRRGFDYFFGFLHGGNDYYQHTHRNQYAGYDLWENETLVAPKYVDKYSTNIFTDKVNEIINDEADKKDQPLFIMFSPEAVHTGNYQNQFQVPKSYVEQNGQVTNYDRRVFAGMISSLDEAVGKIVQKLKESKILDNTVIAFTTDNGGVTWGAHNHVEDGRGSNHPLRGGKGNAWEGGVRGVAFIWSRLIKQRGYVSKHLMHISDWLPTFVRIGSGSTKEYKVPVGIDGLNHWDAFLNIKNENETLREELLIKFDNDKRAYRHGKYKFITGQTLWNSKCDAWYLPPNRTTDIHPSLENHPFAPRDCIVDNILNINRNYSRAVIVNCNDMHKQMIPCDPGKKPCIFDLDEDPCEFRNIFEEKRGQEVYSKIIQAIDKHKDTIVQPLFKPKDSQCNPKGLEFAWWPCQENIEVIS